MFRTFAVFVNLIKTIYIFLKTLYFIVDHYHATMDISRREKKIMDEKPSISQQHIEDKKINHQIQLSVLIIILMTMKIFATITIFETPTL